MPTNYATPGNGASASASSTWSVYYASHMIDGNSATAWVAGVNNVTNQWGKVDLGQARSIAGARIRHSSYQNAWKLQYSTDNTNWSDVAGAGSPYNTRLTFGAISARYWRVLYVADANQGCELTDFELWDELTLPDYAHANVARSTYNVWAVASSTYSGNTAAQAVDGNDATRWVSNVNNVTNQNIILSLGDPFPIWRMRVVHGSAGYVNTWKVQSSVDRATWTDRLTGQTSPGTVDHIFSSPISAAFWRLIYTADSNQGNELGTLELWTPPLFTVTANALLLRSSTGSFTANAAVFGEGPAFQPSAFQSIAFQTGSSGGTGSLTADAALRAERAASLTANAVLLTTQSSTLTADAVAMREAAGSLTADAVVWREQAASFTANAWVGPVTGEVEGSITADAVLSETVAGSVPADAVMRATIAGSLTADAIVRRTQSGSLTADAALLRAITGSLAANAISRAMTTGSATASAVVRRTQSASLAADAVIVSRFFTDAVLKKTIAGSLTASAWIYAPRSNPVGPNQTPLVSILLDEVDITADVILADASFTMNVNGAPGQFRIRVKDVGHEHSFTPGAEVTVDIDGRRRFGGYAMRIRRLYAFPVEDTTDAAAVERFWVIEGVDYNILFTKRVVYNKAQPANPELRSWPIGSADIDVVRDVFRNCTDLLDDGASDIGVTNVGSVNPDFGGVIVTGGQVFGEACRSLNRFVGAIYYFDPYKTLHWVDVDTATAGKSFSDRPTGAGEVGYREFSHAASAVKMANDALVWGAGQGDDQITFGRTVDAASIAAHKRWQFGEFTSQLYKQASVNTRADSIVNGTPQNRRGGKDDQESWTLTTFSTEFMLGDKVDIESEVFGIDDIVPVRTMTLTFPQKHPKFDLVLSHEIDEPWNFFEFPPYPLGGFPPIDIGKISLPEFTVPACDYGANITDTWTRDLPSRWGVCDAGLAWTQKEFPVDTPFAEWQVAGGEGTMRLAAGTATVTNTHSVRAVLPITQTLPIDQTVTVEFNSNVLTTPDPDAALFYLEGGVGNRTEVLIEPYYQRYHVKSSGIDSTTVTGQSFTTAKRIRYRVEAPSTHYVKVWDPGDPEPGAWNITHVDTGTNLTGLSIPVADIRLSHFRTNGDTYSAMEMTLDNLDVVGVSREGQRWEEFGRDLVGGLGNMEWGTGDSGSAWVDDPYSAQADFWVNGVTGVAAAYTASGSAPGMSVPYPMGDATDFTMTARVMPYNASANGTLGFTYVFRVLAGAVGSGYLAGSLYCRIDGYNATLGEPAVSLTTGTSIPAVLSAPFALSFETWYLLKWQRTGNSHRMKLWLDGNSEPEAWTLEQSGIPVFTPGRFGYAMQGRNDTELDIDWIDLDYEGRPCYWETPELVLDSFGDRTVSPSASADLGTSTSGYVWSGASFFPLTPATVQITGGVLQFQGHPTGYGASIWEYSLNSGYTVVEMESMVEIEFRFRSSLVTDDGTFIKTWFGAVDLQLRIDNSGTGQIEIESAVANKTDWVANAWYTVKVALDGPIASVKVWRDEAESEPSGYAASDDFGGVYPGDGGQWFLRPEFGYDPDISGSPHTLTFDYALIRYRHSVAPVSPGGGEATTGETCRSATRVNSTTYQIGSAFTSGSTEVFVDGVFQRPGPAGEYQAEYTESAAAGQIVFNDPVSVSAYVYVCYRANGPVE